MKVLIGRHPKWMPKKKKYDIKRKIVVKVDSFDLWGLDSTLAYIIEPALKAFIKQGIRGAAMVDVEDVPRELRFNSIAEKKAWDEEGKTDKNFFKRWEWVLKEMHWAFKQINSDGEDKFYGKSKKKVVISKSGKKGNTFEFPDWDKKGLEEYRARIKNGLRLFGKYYQGLWD